MKSKKFKIAEFGTVSAGTMREEDLIPCFVSELRYLGHRDAQLSEIEKRSKTKKYYNTEQSSYDLNEILFNMLDSHAPAYAYFGSHPGDGSDYGFWLGESFQDYFDGLKVSDISEIPADYMGEVLHVNDHGNMTLYYKSARKLTEVWSLV